MPVITPAELWKRSGRYDIDEVFKLKDRRGAELDPRPEPRGDRHPPRRADGALLPRAADAALPLPDQGPRRGAPARRRAAHARVHHEGRLLLRSRRGGPAGLLRQVHRAPTTAIFDRVGPRVVPGRVRRRDDGRLGRPRVHGAVPGGRERRRAGARLRRQHRGRERRAAAGAPPLDARRASCTRPGRRRSRRVADAPRRPGGQRCSRPSRSSPSRAGWSWSSCAATIASTRSSSPTRSASAFRPARDERAARAPAASSGPTRRRPDALRRRRSSPGQAYVTGANRPDYHQRGHRRRRRARRRAHASRPATPSTATRSASSPRSRSATSSSSARATPSRSARPTSTRTARSS